MHVIKHRDKKPEPLVPIVSHMKVPFHRRVRGKRYDAQGNFVCDTGPKRTIDYAAQRALKKAYADAAKLGPVVDGEGVTLENYTPLAGMVLCQRAPIITHVRGIAIPEMQQWQEPWYYIIKAGPEVTNVIDGDRVLFERRMTVRPEVRIGLAVFELERADSVIAFVDGVSEAE